ncbi:MAG: TAXI family TRAP transporter solute-binding subunit [Oscillospiraceae bacterium]|nr:TAXI family TRAP transporter solute-binding subunit [Oscillospiraceae bacterium]
MKRVLSCITLVAMLLTLCACGAKETPAASGAASTPAAAPSTGATEYLSLGTGGVTGTYYPLGGALANLLTNNVPGYNCTAESTGGAVENAWLLARGEIDLGFVDASTVFQAQNSQGDFSDGGAKSIKAVMSIYNEIVQLVSCNPNITSIADLKGKKVAVGSAGSGTEVMARTLLGLYDMTYDDIEEDFLGFGDASTGLKDKTLDAAIIWAGAPTSGLLELGAQNDFYMIDIPADKMALLKESQPFCVEATMDSSIYSGMKNSATTIGVPATICAREDLDEQLVYDFLVATFDNLQTVAESHTQGANLSLETCLLGLESAELHPGAVKFYTEKGLL